MQKITLAALLATSVLVCGAANAASSFDGFYGGAIINGHTANISNYSSSSVTTHSFSSETSYAPSLFAGYGGTFSQILYVGAEINYSNEGSKVEETLNDNNVFFVKWLNKVKATKTLGVKLGYLFTDDLMLSVKYKRGNSDVEISRLGCNGCFESSVNLDIQSVALGMDYNLTKNVFATLELGKTTLTQSTPTSNEFYNLGAGLGYRF
jgi:hypothetical protein